MIYLGTINNAGSDCINNLTTSSPFTIPQGVTCLRLQPSAATHVAAMKAGSDATFLPSDATTMLQLGAANSIQDLPISPIKTSPNLALTLAIRKTDAGAATTKVFAVAVP